MSRASFLLFLPALVLTSCREATQLGEYTFPDLHLSSSGSNVVEFGEAEFSQVVSRVLVVENLGELPLGIANITLQDDGDVGMRNSFYFEYTIEDISCTSGTVVPEAISSSDTGDTEASNGSSAKKKASDSGDSGDSGGTGDPLGAPPDSTETDPFVLPGGCKLPVTVSFKPREVGDIYGSIMVESFTEVKEEGNSGQPEYYKDPNNYKEVALLHGAGLKGEGSIKISPRFHDFGHLWIGETTHTQIYIKNEGDGDLFVYEPTLYDGCEEFSLNLDSYDADGIIPAESGTLFEVQYTPVSTNGSVCTISVGSDDAQNSELEIDLQGNLGVDPLNTAPTVEILSPALGYEHTSADDIVLQMYVFDTEQPATSLTCRVKSAVLQEASIAFCTPEDESGYVTVNLPVDDLYDGMDTLLITVTDQGELQAQASTTILWQGTYSDADDDGDGFGNSAGDEEAGAYDCDDSNRNTYPGAAELCDGLDNDCDNAIDENTPCKDDDGDSVSENDGDCDDAYEATYPGAPEQADQRDNDCDGLVDEGTANYDGDGDGYSINNGDCDDEDPERSPAATEYCDGFDNDCDYQTDYSDNGGCEPILFQPMLVGGCLLGERALQIGESTSAEVFIFDPDSDDLTYYWQEDIDVGALGGHTAVNSPFSPAITWTAPPTLQGETALLFTVYMTVTDESDQQDWCFDEIAVYEEPVVDTLAYVINSSEDSGCGSQAALFAPLLPLVVLWRRRRRS
jgi:hypothetical protein